MPLDASPDAAPPLSAGAFNLTAKNISKALKSAPLWLGFSAAHCTYCAVHEPQYSLYASTHAPHLPRLARVDAASERLLQERYEVNELPALVLAWSSTKFTPYAGAHTAAAMAAFADAQLAPASVAVADAAALTQLLPSAPEDVLLVGFFNDLDDETEELDDFREAAAALRRQRPDAVVRGAHATLTRALSDAYGPRGKRWIGAAPCAVVLTGADLAPRAAPYRLDEAAEGGLSLGEWAARAALPDAGELTAANFGAYAATGLPMLLAFVRPSADNRALVGALRGVAARFRGKLLTAHCDGDAHRDRMLALGLRGGELPQLAFNTKDGRQLPFPAGRTPDEPSLSRFAADFLGERLQTAPELPPRRGPPKQPENYVPRASDAGAVVEVGAANFSAVALEVGLDVLLHLYSEENCDACVALVPYYARVAGRLRELGVDSVAVARMDVGVHPMPQLLSSAHRHPLPTVLMLPARRKEPPFAFYDGRAHAKHLLLFAQKHASRPFALPPNPHLTRDEHEAWKQQVADNLPPEKAEAAYEALQRETGLGRGELGLPPRLKDET